MELKKTALHDVHVKLGARMVEFAGFHMPIQYHSIREEHRRVRETVGMFDVSHMGEIIVKGPKALDMVQKVTINDASKLAVGQVQYSAMCYEDGGIVDDLLVYRFADHFLLVVNASNKDKDYEWILKNKIDGCEVLDVSDDYTQLAVQGKKAEPTLQKLTDVDLSAIKYYWFTEGELAGVNMIISRTGYTGEPGFELYFANEHAVDVWNKIMEAGKEFDIEPIGLGARDTLRLEKKMCLYGNDIDETTNPLEAGLSWITKLDKGDFIGREALLKIKEEGLKRKLVAIVLEGQGFPRHGYKILKDGKEVGHVTSGTVSPILNKGIAMGYVAIEFAKIGTPLEIDIRGKRVPAVVIKPPFV
ncbi:glycine cleavage system aminomethyltransferase GcvT [candidate division KSB1 bacterium]|nr:MAG: glycine cleavage system aminomethyltransferase GcvT [candidate division KSB1 bacterium]